MDRPLVTVVIPTWNRAAEVVEAIDSALAQTYRPLEVLVVDDGSTDETARTIANYGGLISSVRRPHGGVAAARNSGIRAARGDLLAFLDSDDLWHPESVTRRVSLLDRAGPDVVCAYANAVQTLRGEAPREMFAVARFRPPVDEGVLLNPLEVFLSRFMLLNQTVLAPRSVLERVGLYDESLDILEDHDLALRLALAGPWAFTTEPLATVRRGGADSLSAMAQGVAGCEEEHLLTIYDKLDRVDGAPAHEQSACARQRLQPREERLLRHRVQLTRRRLRRFAAPAPVRWVGALSERIREAVWTRSPLFPGARVRPLGGHPRPASTPGASAATRT